MAIFTILTLTFMVDMQVIGVDLTHFIAHLHTMADFTILMDSETHGIALTDGIDLVMRTVSGIATTILTTEITTAQLHA